MQFECVYEGVLYVPLTDIVGVVSYSNSSCTGSMRLLLTGGHVVEVNEKRLKDVLDTLWIRSGRCNDWKKPG